jgi:hypothetical protein
MKKFFTAIVALMLAAPSFAQYSSGGFELDKQNLYYGVRLGMTVASLGGDDLKEVSSGSKVGMTLGAVVGLRVSESTPLFLESGLYYTERGAKDVGYTNLEIPLLIKYGFKATDDIAVLPFVGPYFSRAGWGKAKIKGDYSGTNKTTKVGTFAEEKWTGLSRLNMGFKIGCAAEYNKLYVEIGYQIGITDISKNGGTEIIKNLYKGEDHTVRSNAFFANFGVNF